VHLSHPAHFGFLHSCSQGRVLVAHQDSQSEAAGVVVEFGPVLASLVVVGVVEAAGVVVEHSGQPLQLGFSHKRSHVFVLVGHQDLHARCAHSLHCAQLSRLHNLSHVRVLVRHQSLQPVKAVVVVVVSHWLHVSQ